MGVRTHVCPWDWGRKDIYGACTRTLTCAHKYTCIILFHHSRRYFASLRTVWMNQIRTNIKSRVYFSRQLLAGHKHDMVAWYVRWRVVILTNPPTVLPIFNLSPILSIFLSPRCPPPPMCWLILKIRGSAKFNRLTPSAHNNNSPN